MRAERGDGGIAPRLGNLIKKFVQLSVEHLTLVIIGGA